MTCSHLGRFVFCLRAACVARSRAFSDRPIYVGFQVQVLTARCAQRGAELAASAKPINTVGRASEQLGDVARSIHFDFRIGIRMRDVRQHSPSMQSGVISKKQAVNSVAEISRTQFRKVATKDGDAQRQR